MVGLGFTMVYNSTSIINLAQGEFVMLGGLFGVTFVAMAKGAGMPVHVAILVGFCLSVSATTLVGMIMEKLAIEPSDHLTVFHYGGIAAVIFWLSHIVAAQSTVASLLITGAVVAAIYALARKATIESMRNPTVLAAHYDHHSSLDCGSRYRDVRFRQGSIFHGSLRIAAANKDSRRDVIAANSAGGSFNYCRRNTGGPFFSFTMTGKAMQACAFNRSLSKLMGINDRRMILLSFAMAGFVGAVA